MSTHTHEWKPALAPTYACECGALARKKRGAIVAYKRESARERGVLDQRMYWNAGDKAWHNMPKGHRHVSEQPETEES